MEIKEAYLSVYFGKNSDYYLDRWKEYKDGRKISFKPYAFLFGIFWFLYRKMYLIFLLIIVVLIVEGIVEDYILTELLKIK